MNESTKTVLVSRFKPRWYQRDLINALEHTDKRKFIVIWPRRAGKDVCALNVMLRQAFKRVGVYYYLYPSYKQCRAAVWDSILITGEKFLDFIPDELIARKNNVDMKIELVNGSIIKFHGVDKADSLRGSNPVGVVFSEYSRVRHPHAYEGVIAPILAANNGWVVFISTPNGHNDFYDLYKYAKSGEDETWYVKMLTVDETKHMPEDELLKERKRKSEELFMQEYHCSFEIAGDGYYYSKYIQKAYVDGRIGFVPYDSAHSVHTAWDLGWSCPSVILFYQVVGEKVSVIDMYHKNNENLAHYVGVLDQFAREKGYTYGQHFVPHDAVKHDLGTGLNRTDILDQLGIETEVLPRLSLSSGIEIVRNTFNKIFIDEKKCRKLISALELYAQKYDEHTKRFLDADKETWANDYCDAFRYLCTSLSYMSTSGMSREEFNKKRDAMMYGRDSLLSPVFRSE